MKQHAAQSARQILPPYRFFISYSDRDKQHADHIDKALQELGHQVFWAPNTAVGANYVDMIQQRIRTAHFFIPIITSNSLRSLWVQQEIGYAIALNIPVIPIGFSGVSQQIRSAYCGMLLTTHILWLHSRASRNDIIDALAEIDWHTLLEERLAQSEAIFQCDEQGNRIPQLIARSADIVDKEARTPVRVMQRSMFTSFSLPSSPADPKWQRIKNIQQFFWFDPQERDALEQLIKKGECDLYIDPCYFQPGYDIQIYRAKLETLRDFLSQYRKKQLRVVIGHFDRSGSETIIGDYWMAHAAPDTTNVDKRETISTWHAPTVRRQSVRFQKTFNDLLERQAEKFPGRTSVDHALDRIACRLAMLAGIKSKRPVLERCRKCKFR